MPRVHRLPFAHYWRMTRNLSIAALLIGGLCSCATTNSSPRATSAIGPSAPQLPDAGACEIVEMDQSDWQNRGAAGVVVKLPPGFRTTASRSSDSAFVRTWGTDSAEFSVALTRSAALPAMDNLDELTHCTHAVGGHPGRIMMFRYLDRYGLVAYWPGVRPEIELRDLYMEGYARSPEGLRQLLAIALALRLGGGIG